MKKIVFILFCLQISFAAMAQDPFLGEIRAFAFGFVPNGWIQCNGQTLNIVSNQALYSLLGTTYGGNGTSTFAVPNLADRIVIGPGQGSNLPNYSLAQTGGSKTFTISMDNMPTHTHTGTNLPAASANLQVYYNNVTAASPSPEGTYYAKNASNFYSATYNTVMASSTSSCTTESAGISQAANGMMPYLAMNYCICVSGLYPTTSGAGFDPLLGEIKLFAGNFIPGGWAACNGQSLTIMQNQALYSLLGTNYGGNSTTFMLPDLKGRTPIHIGQGAGLTNHQLAEKGGSIQCTLTATTLPSHNHLMNFPLMVSNLAANNASPENCFPTKMASNGFEAGTSHSGSFITTGATLTTSSSSAGSASPTPITTTQPFVSINYIIATTGLYPTRY